MKKKLIFYISVLFAVILIAYGFIEGTTEFSIFKAENNHETMSAIFSLAGVSLFFAALIYQIKEYENQLDEIKKSVKAQTKSSEAQMESSKALKTQIEVNKEQLVLYKNQLELNNKQLKLNEKQSNNDMTFRFMESYSDYYKNNNERELIQLLFNKFVYELNNSLELHKNIDNELGILIKNILNEVTSRAPKHKNTLEHFYLYTANTIGIIIEYQASENSQKSFTSNFLNRLTRIEATMLLLCPLINFNTSVIINRNCHNFFKFKDNNINHLKELYKGILRLKDDDFITNYDNEKLLHELNELIENNIE